MSCFDISIPFNVGCVKTCFDGSIVGAWKFFTPYGFIVGSERPRALLSVTEETTEFLLQNNKKTSSGFF